MYEPEGVLTTTWGGGGEANAHYIFMKAIYLGILFLYDSSLKMVALQFYRCISRPPIREKTARSGYFDAFL